MHAHSVLRAGIVAAGCAALVGGAFNVLRADANAGQKTISIPVTLSVSKDCKIVSGPASALKISVTLPRGDYDDHAYFFTVVNESVLCEKGTSVNPGPYSGSVTLLEYPQDHDGDESTTLRYWIAPPGTKLTTGFGTNGAACPPSIPVLSPLTSTASTTPIVYPIFGCVRFPGSIDGGTFQASLPADKLTF
ncbi:MAG TPA: hypothetical protein VK669_09420 [Candidatus Limnocylindrales bacterium]|nr:hypothetical protein [Candidatus Limnocylindrales bacterium]